MSDLIEIINKEGTLRAGINPENGQLCSLQRDGQEFMWGGGKPEHLKAPHEKKEAGGWQNSAIVMFPIIGLAKNNSVTVDGVQYKMPRHGIARYLLPTDIAVGKHSIGVKREYHCGAPVETPSGFARFATSFAIYELYDLTGNSLEVTFNILNRSDELMSYALGYHPAFKLPLNMGGRLRTLDRKQLHGAKSWHFGQISKFSYATLILDAITQVKCPVKAGTLKVKSDMGHTMAWRPSDQPVISLESITALPAPEHTGEFAGRPGNREIRPGSIVVYQVKITPTATA
ncbi:MAG: hypothetical protein HY438_00125 [DPANN group archaeon]|nr:hypothetical protein [DPANN group archaeon]